MRWAGGGCWTWWGKVTGTEWSLILLTGPHRARIGVGGRRSIGRSIDTSSDRSISIYGRINRSMRRNICRNTGRGAGINNYRSIGRNVIESSV